MPWTNDEAARLLSELVTREQIDGADRYRVRAHERAAASVAGADADLAELTVAQMAELPGIGESTAKKVAEVRDTGSIAELSELRERIPDGVVALTRVEGIGPKTAKMLYQQASVDSLERLREALDSGELAGLPGLKQKTLDNIRAGLERLGDEPDTRTPLADAAPVADELASRLRALDAAERVEVAGSLRRVAETIGDVDILVATDDPAGVHDAVRADDLVTEVILSGETKTSVRTVRGLQVDVRTVPPASFGAALVYFTGSQAHNIRMRELAVRAGLSVSEYAVTREPGDVVASETESTVYAAIGLDWVPPPMREDTGEVAAAADGTLPAAATTTDLRGDLHVHSDYSGDGKASLERMLAAASDRGLDYVAVTDHAENLPMNGMSRDTVLRRRDHLGRAAEDSGVAALDGAELNIALDGSLDYDEELLAAFDVCVASIHTRLDADSATQTDRLIAACRHPVVTVIGHPTGRKIGMREPYPFDADAVIAAARETGTALEVNAHPRRLDLSGDLTRRAMAAGATLAISTDAHAPSELDNRVYGVGTAQRGWVTPERVLTARDLDGLLDFVAAKRRGSGWPEPTSCARGRG